MASLLRPPVSERLRLYGRTARRSVRRQGVRPHGAVGRLHPGVVFVVGCPRSGTTFTAGAIGSVTGFFDLGEVNRLKAAIPGLHAAVAQGQEDAVVDELRAIVRRSQRVAFAAGRRGVEQSPECSYVIPQLARAFPGSTFVHLLRDGRDVAASLLEKGWLGDAAVGRDVDDAGLQLGRHARFWVEPGREAEFEAAPEERRCAWAWRRYESVAADHLAGIAPDRWITVRYEDLAADPAAIAVQVATALGSPAVAEFVEAFAAMRSSSVGRHRDVLTAAQLATVEAEAGDLLRQRGYPVGA